MLVLIESLEVFSLYTDEIGQPDSSLEKNVSICKSFPLFVYSQNTLILQYSSLEALRGISHLTLSISSYLLSNKVIHI